MQPLKHSPGLDSFSTRRVALLAGDRNTGEMLHTFFRLMELDCSLIRADFSAVATIRRLDPDVVILDLDLPNLRALEIADELQHVPIILITDQELGARSLSAPVMKNPHDRFEDLLRLFEMVLAAERG
ncbi:MAG: hypothetical protein ABI779_13165 [Acidobacteriota bacterium]